MGEFLSEKSTSSLQQPAIMAQLQTKNIWISLMILKTINYYYVTILKFLANLLIIMQAEPLIKQQGNKIS